MAYEEEINWLAQGCLNKKDRTVDYSNKESEEQLLVEMIYKLVLKLNDHTFFDAMVLSEEFSNFVKEESIRRNKNQGQNNNGKDNSVWLRSMIRFFETNYVHMIWWHPQKVNYRMTPRQYKTINNGLSYSKKTFTNQPEWCQDAAIHTEEQFSILRERQLCYRDIKILLRKYSRLTQKLYDVRYKRTYNQIKSETSEEIDENYAEYGDGIVRKVPQRLTNKKVEELTKDHIMDGLGTEGIYKKLVKKFSKKDKTLDQPSKYSAED